jgi:hypothetical protein
MRCDGVNERVIDALSGKSFRLEELIHRSPRCLDDKFSKFTLDPWSQLMQGEKKATSSLFVVVCSYSTANLNFLCNISRLPSSFALFYDFLRSKNIFRSVGSFKSCVTFFVCAVVLLRANVYAGELTLN